MHGQSLNTPFTLAEARGNTTDDRFEVLNGAKAAELRRYINAGELAGLIETVERILRVELWEAKLALTQGNRKHAIQSLHKIDGMCANYGIQPVADEARALQVRLVGTRRRDHGQSVRKLEELVDLALSDLAEFRRQIGERQDNAAA